MSERPTLIFDHAAKVVHSAKPDDPVLAQFRHAAWQQKATASGWQK